MSSFSSLDIPPSHKSLGLLHDRNGAVAAPLALQTLPWVVLLQYPPAVSWSLGRVSALGPVGSGRPLWQRVVGLFVIRLCAGDRTREHLRLCAVLLAPHATAVAPVAVEEEKPYADPDKCNHGDHAHADEYGNGGPRDASRGRSRQEAGGKMVEGGHDGCRCWIMFRGIIAATAK